MPAQSSWYLRVTDIVAQLHSPAAPPFLDRAAIEDLFHLRRRQAIRLMGACGGYQIGKTYLVDRGSLLRFLDRLTRKGVVDEALHRSIPDPDRRICPLELSSLLPARSRSPTLAQLGSGKDPG